MAKDAERALEVERKQTQKREQRRLSVERKEQRARERETIAVRKASERATRDATREERRRKKLEIRLQREKFAQEQKEAALKRAAELVASNRVPIEITRGSAAAKAAANAAVAAVGVPVPTPEEEALQKKSRSSIVVSTASDLHRIVTHAKNLWTKYNAIAKEHNQKVNWITVARELGIHVKVREKYQRMHSRAEQRGFDWKKNGHWKIKDHPQIFLEPTQAEQKAKMPPPPPDPATTVLIDHSEASKDMVDQVTNDAVAAAAAVVDAAGVKVEGVAGDHEVPTDETATAAAAAVAVSSVGTSWSPATPSTFTPAASTTAAAAATASLVTWSTISFEASLWSIKTVVAGSGGGGGIFAFCSACVGSKKICGWSFIFQCPFFFQSNPLCSARECILWYFSRTLTCIPSSRATVIQLTF
mmetsp:Transcript_8096/g.12655  ORF Transcript_8096/g.12655 Transcript_8096/m.12655 type:complete len:417 (-) Transcript_8096:2460-3710(-)